MARATSLERSAVFTPVFYVVQISSTTVFTFLCCMLCSLAVDHMTVCLIVASGAWILLHPVLPSSSSCTWSLLSSLVSPVLSSRRAVVSCFIVTLSWQCSYLLSIHTFLCVVLCFELPSVLWHCWLGVRKSIWFVKKFEWWGAGMVICLERGANDLHMVQLMPLRPHHLLLH